MTEVPRTETWVDRQAHYKKLEGEITVLTGLKDTANREAKESVKRADVSRETLKKLNEDIDKVFTILETAEKETIDYMIHCQKLIQDNSTPMKEILGLYSEITRKCEESAVYLKRIENAGIVIHEKCVKDLELVDIARNDISVYKSRLQEYFRKYLPNQKIIL